MSPASRTPSTAWPQPWLSRARSWKTNRAGGPSVPGVKPAQGRLFGICVSCMAAAMPEQGVQLEEQQILAEDSVGNMVGL